MYEITVNEKDSLSADDRHGYKPLRRLRKERGYRNAERPQLGRLYRRRTHHPL